MWPVVLFRLFIKFLVAGIYIAGVCIGWSYRAKLMGTLEPLFRWVDAIVALGIDAVVAATDAAAAAPAAATAD